MKYENNTRRKFNQKRYTGTASHSNRIMPDSSCHIDQGLSDRIQQIFLV